MMCVVTEFWKTILLGTTVNFLFYSLNEGPGSCLSCVKFQLDILKHSRYMAILLFNTLQTNFYSMLYCVFWVIKYDKLWQITLLTNNSISLFYNTQEKSFDC